MIRVAALVLVACGLELTTQLGHLVGHPYETLRLQQLFLLGQTVRMRKEMISTLLSAVLLKIASSCGNDYGKLATTVNEMEGFCPAK